MYSGTLIVKPLMAQLKHSTEWFGKMDPYVIAKVGNQQQKTKPAHDQDKKPTWTDVLRFNIHGDTTMQITLYDKDNITFDDFIAETMINLVEVCQRGNFSNQYPLRRKGKDNGWILIAFEFQGQSGQPGGQAGWGTQPGFGAPGVYSGQTGFGAHGNWGGQGGYGAHGGNTGQGGYSGPSGHSGQPGYMPQGGYGGYPGQGGQGGYRPY